MKKDDRVYLQHIMDAIARIGEYIGNREYRAFMTNHLIQDAVVRQIEIIGEATKNLSKKCREQNKDVEWRDIAGMRDKLIHDYMGVDLDAVWRTAKNDIPSLRTKISAILKNL